MVVYKIYCDIGEKGYLDFLKGVGVDAIKDISPCKRIDDDDFTSFIVMEEKKNDFVSYLKSKEIEHRISIKV